MVGQIEGCATGGTNFQFDQDAEGNLVGVWQDSDVSNGPVIRGATQPAGGEWSTAVQISSSSYPSVQPIIEVASNGDAVALWFASDSSTGNSILMSSMLPYLGTWSTPVIISDSANEQILNNAYGISIDSSGRLVALWTAYLNINGGSLTKTIRSASGIFGGSWNAPVTVDPI